MQEYVFVFNFEVMRNLLIGWKGIKRTSECTLPSKVKCVLSEQIEIKFVRQLEEWNFAFCF